MAEILAEIIIVPASPAVVRELAPADPAGAEIRAAVADLASRAQLVGAELHAAITAVGSQDPRWETGIVGSFQAWGAPQVQVGGGTFLPELVIRYLFPQAEIRNSRAHILPAQGMVVVAVDGSAGLTDRAPLALLPQAAATHAWCQQLLAGQAVAPRCAEELGAAGVLEPDLWLELAELLRTHEVSAELLVADASLGVGRYVARWQVQRATNQPHQQVRRVTNHPDQQEGQRP